jgi:long-chain fatty acid transport protein
MSKAALFKKSVIALAITLTTQQAFAAGFQLNAQSATGLGRAFAGDAVIADNASVIARNPAAMAMFDEKAMSLGFESITTMIEVSDATYTNRLSGASSSADYDDAGDTSIAPNFYFITPINEKVALGASIYSNFGTKTEFSDDYAGAEYGGLSDVKSINFGLTASYRIDSQWSVGAGLDAIYGQGKLQREFDPTLAATLTALNFISTSTALDVDADGWAVGFNLGTVYEKNEDTRFGLDYHYSPDLKADGDVAYGGGSSISDTLILPLPDMAEFSGYHRINNNYAVHYSIQWIQWSEFDKLEAETTGTLNDYKWKDAFHYSIGGTYYLNDTWTLRAGYMYDESAQDKITSISVPDSDRQWLSAGFGYKLSEKATIDFGATYLFGKDVEVEEESAKNGTTLSSLTGTTHADALMLGLQYSRTF